MTLEVSPQQRESLENMLAALPSEPTDEKVKGGSKLASLFYHPNTACRVMALVLSGGIDAANGRAENAAKKLDRAIQVFTLVSDDAEGRERLEGLKASLDVDVSGFLGNIRSDVAPYLQKRIDGVVSDSVFEKPAEPAMPRAIEEGESMPEEKRRAPKTRPKRERPPREERAPEPVVEAAAPEAEAEAAPAEPEVAEEAVEAAVEEAPAAKEAASRDEDDAGPTEAEAAAVAAAALAAMETPYEEIVEDDAPPRFDPNDVPTGDGRRRRRRRAPEGLERPGPEAAEAAEAPAQAPKPAASVEEEAGALEPIVVARGGNSDALAEIGLDVLRMALKRAREAGLSGRLRVAVTVETQDGEAREGDDDSRRRRRRRRGRGRGGRRDD